MSHTFAISLEWQSNLRSPDAALAEYSREGVMTAAGHDPVSVSAAGGFGGDIARWNPEELVIGALSQCHMLSFLWVARDEGVAILDYRDDAQGSMEMRGGTGAMTQVTLRPHVVVASTSEADRVEALHERAAGMCIIRASVNFPVELESGVSVR